MQRAQFTHSKQIKSKIFAIKLEIICIDTLMYFVGILIKFHQKSRINMTYEGDDVCLLFRTVANFVRSKTIWRK